MDVNSSKAQRLLSRLEALHATCRPGEPWTVEQEPHDYPDGTEHFSHVVSMAHMTDGGSLKVSIGRRLTPELAELLVLMRNNLPDLIRWSRTAAEVQ